MLFGNVLSEIGRLIDQNDPLSGKIRKSLAVIQNAIDRYGKEAIGICFNGGKDCTVVLYLMIYAYAQKYPDGFRIDAYYVNEKGSFAEIEEFVRRCQDSFPFLSVQSSKDSMQLAMAEFSRRGKRAFLMGTRRSDPSSGNCCHFYR